LGDGEEGSFRFAPVGPFDRQGLRGTSSRAELPCSRPASIASIISAVPMPRQLYRSGFLFALRVAGVSRAEVDERVRRAAEMQRVAATRLGARVDRVP
jgi:hypothetical protein